MATVGRWGNWFNQELFGKPTTLPWGLEIDAAHRPADYIGVATFHPTFLYESLWNLLVFALLVRWIRPRIGRYPGAVFFAYIGLYSVGRFVIEALRLDSFWIGPLRVGQLASAAGVLVAAAGIWWALRRPPLDVRPAAGAPAAATGRDRGRRGRRPPG